MVRVSFHNFSKIVLISDNVASWAENLILVQLTAVPQCRSAAVRLKNNHYQLARNEFRLGSRKLSSNKSFKMVQDMFGIPFSKS